MSGLFDPFLPTSVHTLAFASSALAKVARDMASGQLHDNLLLHGDPGCGKSHLAGLIVSNRYPQLSLSMRTYEGALWDANSLSSIVGQMNWDSISGITQHYTVINEVDQMSDKDRERLKAFMDGQPLMKFVMTTNAPGKISGALRSRSNLFHMQMMPAPHIVPIVQQAAQSLGKTASTARALAEIAASNGDWRRLEQRVHAI